MFKTSVTQSSQIWWVVSDMDVYKKYFKKSQLNISKIMSAKPKKSTIIV